MLSAKWWSFCRCLNVLKGPKIQISSLLANTILANTYMLLESLTAEYLVIRGQIISRVGSHMWWSFAENFFWNVVKALQY